MTDHQIRRRDAIRPLASIPQKEGAVILGIDRKGAEARLIVFVDKSGQYTVPGYSELVGWRLLP